MLFAIGYVLKWVFLFFAVSGITEFSAALVEKKSFDLVSVAICFVTRFNRQLKTSDYLYFFYSCSLLSIWFPCVCVWIKCCRFSEGVVELYNSGASFHVHSHMDFFLARWKLTLFDRNFSGYLARWVSQETSCRRWYMYTLVLDKWLGIYQ